MDSRICSAELQSELDRYLAIAQHEPVIITNNNDKPQAVLVSPEFFHAAMEALEDQADIEAAAKARNEQRIPHEALTAMLDGIAEERSALMKRLADN
ncbi:type II toxin-antitoxin system prevent-host-death family antitoxin [Corynebacterium hindlerae]|uniref:type II toxin-antitoxin system prevent-host-death family antitoxin n=1 Tax=Corynebacterium hindlerae TaxID=699041 RepID=UPI003AAA3136